MKKTKKILVVIVILLIINLVGFIPKNLPDNSETNSNFQDGPTPTPNNGDQILLHTYNFEDQTLGQDPTYETFTIDESSGDVYIDDLGDGQHKHMALHKVGTTGRVWVKDNFSLEGETYVSGAYHLKVYHDNSGFGINLNSANGECILAMVWWNGEIRDNVGGTFLANYALNQWLDVIIYFDLNVGWMFDLNGVRYGAGYSFPFFGAFTANAEHIWMTSFVSGGGDGYFRVDDISAYYNIINIFSPLNQTYTNAMNGYYPATYGFENDLDGSSPEEWYNPTGGDHYINVVSERFGHKKVLEAYDGVTGGGWSLFSYFDNTEGTIEFWWAISSIASNKQHQIGIFNDTTAATPLLGVMIDAGQIKVLTGGSWISIPGLTTTVNTWDHVRIDFRSDSGNYYQGLNRNEYRLYYNGIDEGTYNFQNVGDTNTLRLYSGWTPTDVYGYYDAFGFSWDPYYKIGDNLYEGLLVSVETETPLESMSYSLDSQPKRSILGNITIPMPEGGLHTIQIFGIDIFGTHYQSDIRYFTIDFPIDIITPEAKSYSKSMDGYYPGTFGFEDVPDDSLPSYCYYDAWGTSPDWTNSYTKVIDEKIDAAGNKHNKVLVLNDLSSGSACGSNLNFTEYGSEIARDCTIEFYFCIRTTSSIHYLSRLSLSGNYGALFTFNFNSWSSLNDPEILFVNSSGEFSTGFYQEWDKWYRYSVDISCDGGYAGLGVNQFRFRIYNDTGAMIYTSYAMDFTSTHPTGGPNRFTMISTQSQTQVYEYLDAFSITGLQDGYELGDNLNEGLLLSFENSTYLDWTGYSLDGQTNKTILGNTTIPLPKEGLHSIRVYGNDSLGTMYQSNVRHFSVHHINIITPEDKIYTEAMSGYYPATYGFEDDKIGSLPNFGDDFSLAGGTIDVLKELDGHTRVLELNDTSGVSIVKITNNFTISNGTIELWVRTDDINKESWIVYVGNSGIYPIDFIELYIDNGVWRYSDGTTHTNVPNVPNPQNNTWHRITIHFRCSGAPAYKGLSDNKWKCIIDGVDSGELNPRGTTHTSLIYMQFLTNNADENYSFFIDAIGYSWDPNYNIGDNLNEGLLLSYENSTNLDWQGYSLNNQHVKTILGNTSIPLPNDGSHYIQIFGNGTLGEPYWSETRYFTIDTGSFFNISTPENKTYYAPMLGYYPATFGFDADEINSYPKGWVSNEYGGTIGVYSKFNDHNKVIKLNDTNGGNGNNLINQINDIEEGIIEFWMGTDNIIELNEFDIWDNDDTNWGIQLSIQSSKFQYKKSDNIWYDIPYVGIPLNNKLHHWKLEFNCSTYKFHAFIDGIDSGELEFKNNHSSFDRIQFHTSDSGSGFSMYVDAVGFSWDPYYTIGDNVYEGLYLSFKPNSELNWIDYSLNGKNNSTIFGNTTIPFSNLNEGINIIQLFGEDFRGVLYESEIRYFSVGYGIDIITPEDKIYTEPMGGYYPATLGFENDDNGESQPEKFNNLYSANCGGEVFSEIEGHKKVFGAYDSNNAGSAQIKQHFNDAGFQNQTHGTVEYWFRVTSVSYNTEFRLNWGYGINDAAIILRISGYQWQYNDGSWVQLPNIPDPTANTWYHMRFDFRCGGASSYLGLGENQYNITINGVKSGLLAFTTPSSEISMFSPIYTAGGAYAGNYAYIDAIHYSWDTNYNFGDNLYEGLLLSYSNNTNLDWMGYSLDFQPINTIWGNTTIPMPLDGEHIIRVSGNDSMGELYQSKLRHFGVYSINIITPENKTYTEPMSGYYPATYGFENDEEGKFPNGWYTDVAYGGTCEVINSYNNHKKIVNLTDTVLSNQTQMKNNISNRNNGTIDFYYLIEDSNMRTVFSLYETDTSDGIYLRVDSGYLAYRTDAYYNIIPILNNTWYHISIAFNSTANKFWITIDGTTFGGSSGYNYRNPNTMMSFFAISSSILHENYSFYIDAIGYSWDPNYNIGDNLNEGLLLSYENRTTFGWQGYSLDGQLIKTILGNTTIPMPSEGLHTIQVFGNDTLGIMRYSPIRYFTIVSDIFPPTITINSPLLNDLFGSSGPFYNLTILDLDLNTTWYTLDGGLINITITESTGNIDQTEWDKIGNGTATIRFYANDTLGNTGFEEVTVRKDILTPEITITSPEANYLFGSSVPSFDLNIVEPNLNTMWYTLDGGVTLIPISGPTGTIEQTEWDKFSNGTVTIRFCANDTVGNSGWKEVTVRKDILPPEITIISPTENHVSTDIAPSFELTINEGNLYEIWYTLDDGLINITCGTTGQIIQAYWNALPPGDYTLKFYATDTLGHEGFAEVIVKKGESPAIPGYNILILSLIMIFGLISISWDIKKRIK